MKWVAVSWMQQLIYFMRSGQASCHKGHKINKDIKSIRIGKRTVWQIYRYDLKSG